MECFMELKLVGKGFELEQGIIETCVEFLVLTSLAYMTCLTIGSTWWTHTRPFFWTSPDQEKSVGFPDDVLYLFSASGSKSKNHSRFVPSDNAIWRPVAKPSTPNKLRWTGSDWLLNTKVQCRFEVYLDHRALHHLSQTRLSPRVGQLCRWFLIDKAFWLPVNYNANQTDCFWKFKFAIRTTLCARLRKKVIS